MTGFTELRDQINRTTDLQEKELLQQQFEMMHQAADEESKAYEDLIRGEWDEFKDVAHKTVAELFDMLKAKEAAIQEMDEVIKMQDADLRKYEKRIESLKTQLAVYKEDMQNDAEKIAYEQMQASSWKAEYLKMVAERDELQSKSQCIRNLVEQRNLAENMLRKISVAAQKKFPTFGAALRFNDEVKEILRGNP